MMIRFSLAIWLVLGTIQFLLGHDCKQGILGAVNDAISVGPHRMQRNFEPMRKQVEAWRQSELTGVSSGQR